MTPLEFSNREYFIYFTRMKPKICILSGAGISAESGIQTFRDSDGLWENHRIADVATPEAWQHNPALVQEFYNHRRKQIINCQPNAAHYFLSELEHTFEVQIITQNIDDLHERSGSSNIVHLHGNIRLAKSSGPNPDKKFYPIDGWELRLSDRCDDGFLLRPHVVWFGESVPMMDTAASLVAQAEVFIVIGTSLNVYPAANLALYANNATLKILIDPKAESLHVPSDFYKINETAVNAIPFLSKLLKTYY